jgi:hypothetical protein
MGLPLDPVVCDEDPVPAVLVIDSKGISPENAAPSVAAEEPGREREEEQAADASKSSGSESREDTVE